jgi:hypothetical protein
MPLQHLLNVLVQTANKVGNLKRNVCRLSRQRGILDILQLYRPQRCTTGIAFYFNFKVIMALELSENILSGYTLFQLHLRTEHKIISASPQNMTVVLVYTTLTHFSGE